MSYFGTETCPALVQRTRTPWQRTIEHNLPGNDQQASAIMERDAFQRKSGVTLSMSWASLQAVPASVTSGSDPDGYLSLTAMCRNLWMRHNGGDQYLAMLNDCASKIETMDGLRHICECSMAVSWG